MKRRFPAFILALVLCIGLAVPASAATVQTKAGANLTAAEQNIYDALADTVAAVAEGRETSTETFVEFDSVLSWTRQELGLSSTDDWTEIDQSLYDKFAPMMDRAYTCLELNFPFEMFWANNYWTWTYWDDNDDETVRITGLTCTLDVTPAYRDGSGDMSTADPDKIAQGRAAVENAKAIVKANEGKSDYEKLTAYRDAIC